MTIKKPNEKKRRRAKSSPVSGEAIAPAPQHPNLNELLPLVGTTPPTMDYPDVPPPLPPIVAKLKKAPEQLS
jgi:hypothetical protein